MSATKYKYQEIRCTQTGMVQTPLSESTQDPLPYQGIIVKAMTEARSSFESSPGFQSYHNLPKAPCGIEYNMFHSFQANIIKPHDIVIDFFGRRHKRTESEIIVELQKEINELKVEVSHLKQRDKREERIHYVEIHELPFPEIKNQVLEYYKTHEEIYPDDIAVSLGLDLESVMKAVYELKDEGELEVVH
jgi:hypothetical protein